MKDLRLNRHVKRRRRLVRDQKSGTAGQGDGDDYSLLHSTGKLMWILDGTLSWDSHQFQHVLGLFPGIILIQVFVTLKALCNLLPNGEYRV